MPEHSVRRVCDMWVSQLVSEVSRSGVLRKAGMGETGKKIGQSRVGGSG